MPRCNTVQSRELVEHDCATWPDKERATWLENFADLEEDEEPLWSRPTQYNRATVYNHYLRCVRSAGLSDAISRKGVSAFIRACEADNTVVRTIDGYVAALEAMAGFFNPDVKRKFRWLTRARKKIRLRAERTPKGKNKWIVSAEELYELGRTLIGKARTLGANGGWKAAQLYRDGLLLCFGTQAPERLRALTAMTVDDGRSPGRLILFHGKVVKTGKARRRTYTAEVQTFLDEWIDSFRARYAGDHDMLWIAKGGRPASDSALRAAMKKATGDHLGIPLTPNRLRDAVATLIVTRAPEKAALATIMLDHSSEEMTRNYTETADQIMACREAARLIAAGEEKAFREARAKTRSEIALNPRRRRRRKGARRNTPRVAVIS